MYILVIKRLLLRSREILCPASPQLHNDRGPESSGFRVPLYWGGHDSVIRIIFSINIEAFVPSTNLPPLPLKEKIQCVVLFWSETEEKTTIRELLI